MQIGDPLFSFLGHAEVANGALDIAAHDVPVEFCVALAPVSGCLVSELLVEADLLELIEEGRAPQEAIWVTKLADEELSTPLLLRFSPLCLQSVNGTIKIPPDLPLEKGGE